MSSFGAPKVRKFSGLPLDRQDAQEKVKALNEARRNRLVDEKKEKEAKEMKWTPLYTANTPLTPDKRTSFSKRFSSSLQEGSSNATERRLTYAAKAYATINTFGTQQHQHPLKIVEGDDENGLYVDEAGGGGDGGGGDVDVNNGTGSGANGHDDEGDDEKYISLQGNDEAEEMLISVDAAAAAAVAVAKKRSSYFSNKSRGRVAAAANSMTALDEATEVAATSHTSTSSSSSSPSSISKEAKKKRWSVTQGLVVQASKKNNAATTPDKNSSSNSNGNSSARGRSRSPALQSPAPVRRPEWGRSSNEKKHMAASLSDLRRKSPFRSIATAASSRSGSRDTSPASRAGEQQQQQHYNHHHHELDLQSVAGPLPLSMVASFQRYPSPPSTSGGVATPTSTIPDLFRTYTRDPSSDAAELHRLSSWLEGAGLLEYLPQLRSGGVNKLSVLELLTMHDLLSLRLTEEAASLLMLQVKDMSWRTRNISEQAMNEWPSSSSGARGRGGWAAGGQTPPSSSSFSSSSNFPSSSSRGRGRSMSPPLTGGVIHARRSASSRSRSPASARASSPFSTSFSDKNWKDDKPALNAALLKAFDRGDGDLFMFPWHAAVAMMPSEVQSALGPGSSQSPGFNARVVIEFHLHLYFAVCPLKDPEGLGLELGQRRMAALRNCIKEATAISPLARSSSMYTPGPMASLLSTPEYIAFAPLAEAQDPLNDPAFSSLFSAEWAERLRSRLKLFLSVMGLDDDDDDDKEVQGASSEQGGGRTREEKEAIAKARAELHLALTAANEGGEGETMASDRKNSTTPESKKPRRRNSSVRNSGVYLDEEIIRAKSPSSLQNATAASGTSFTHEPVPLRRNSLSISSKNSSIMCASEGGGAEDGTSLVSSPSLLVETKTFAATYTPSTTDSSSSGNNLNSLFSKTTITPSSSGGKKTNGAGGLSKTLGASPSSPSTTMTHLVHKTSLTDQLKSYEKNFKREMAKLKEKREAEALEEKEKRRLEEIQQAVEQAQAELEQSLFFLLVDEDLPDLLNSVAVDITAEALVEEAKRKEVAAQRAIEGAAKKEAKEREAAEKKEREDAERAVAEEEKRLLAKKQQDTMEKKALKKQQEEAREAAEKLKADEIAASAIAAAAASEAEEKSKHEQEEAEAAAIAAEAAKVAAVEKAKLELEEAEAASAKQKHEQEEARIEAIVREQEEAAAAREAAEAAKVAALEKSKRELEEAEAVAKQQLEQEEEKLEAIIREQEVAAAARNAAESSTQKAQEAKKAIDDPTTLPPAPLQQPKVVTETSSPVPSHAARSPLASLFPTQQVDEQQKEDPPPTPPPTPPLAEVEKVESSPSPATATTTSTAVSAPVEKPIPRNSIKLTAPAASATQSELEKVLQRRKSMDGTSPAAPELKQDAAPSEPLQDNALLARATIPGQRSPPTARQPFRSSIVQVLLNNQDAASPSSSSSSSAVSASSASKSSSSTSSSSSSAAAAAAKRASVSVPTKLRPMPKDPFVTANAAPAAKRGSVAVKEEKPLTELQKKFAARAAAAAAAAEAEAAASIEKDGN